MTALYYYWYRINTERTIAELRKALVEEYLSAAASGADEDWSAGPDTTYHYRLIPYERVPVVSDDWIDRRRRRHGYQRKYIREALRRLKTRRPEVLYARDAPLLLTHRGKWVGIAPVILL